MHMCLYTTKYLSFIFKVFFNSITNSSHDIRPQNTRGGLLADDMGLGKTLQVLCLCYMNAHPSAIQRAKLRANQQSSAEREAALAKQEDLLYKLDIEDLKAFFHFSYRNAHSTNTIIRL